MTAYQSLLGGFVFASGIASFVAGLYALSRKSSTAASPFAYLCFGTAIYLFGYGMELNSTSLAAMRNWNLVQYIGIPFLSAFWALFAFHHNAIVPKRPALMLVSLFAVPVLTFGMRITNGMHHLYYTSMALNTEGPFPVMSIGKGAWYYVQAAFSAVCFLISAWLFVRKAVGSSGQARTESVYLIVASTLPSFGMVFNILEFFGPGIDHTALFYPVACAVIVPVLFRDRLLRLRPIARDLVFDNSSDCIVVLDRSARVVLFNPAASRILPRLAEGMPAAELLEMLGIRGPVEAQDAQVRMLVDGRSRSYKTSIIPIEDNGSGTGGTVMTLSDITRITSTLQALSDREEKLRHITDSINEAFWLRSKESGTFLYASPAFTRIWGIPVPLLYEDPGLFLRAIHEEDRWVESRLTEPATVGPVNVQFRIRTPEGAVRWVWVRCSPVTNPSSGDRSLHAGIAADITEQKRMEERIRADERILEAINRATTELIVQPDLDDAIRSGFTHVGEAAHVARIYLFETGTSEGTAGAVPALKLEWTGRRLSLPAAVSQDSGNKEDAGPAAEFPPLEGSVFTPLTEALGQGIPFRSHVRSIADPALRSVLEARNVLSVLILPLSANDRLWGFVGFDECVQDRVWIDSDITLLSTFTNSLSKAIERRIYEKKIEYMSYHDALTGLHNRAHFEKRIKDPDIAGVVPLTVVMADVNGLKLTNDAFGHEAGDTLLRTAATVIRKACRPQDVLARTGGDEFVILMPGLDSVEATLAIASITEAASRQTGPVGTISISFGWETRTDLSVPFWEILKTAEDSMYRQKLSESSNMRHATISIIMKTLYSRNEREQGHSERVGSLCASIARAMGFGVEGTAELRMAGLMHDIGKIGISDAILAKKEPLDEAEWSQMRRHAEIGYRILSLVNKYSRIADWILAHHERWDGGGYPNRIGGQAIPLQARIIAVANAWDAMVGEAPPESPASGEGPVAGLRAMAGSVLDPVIVDLFLGKVIEGRVEAGLPAS